MRRASLLVAAPVLLAGCSMAPPVKIPAHCGCASGTTPLAMYVQSTGAPSVSARVRTAVGSTPRVASSPITSTGRRADHDAVAGRCRIELPERMFDHIAVQREALLECAPVAVEHADLPITGAFWPGL